MLAWALKRSSDLMGKYLPGTEWMNWKFSSTRCGKQLQPSQIKWVSFADVFADTLSSRDSPSLRGRSVFVVHTEREETD